MEKEKHAWYMGKEWTCIRKDCLASFTKLLQECVEKLDFPETIAPIVASLLAEDVWLPFDVDAEQGRDFVAKYPCVVKGERSAITDFFVTQGVLFKRGRATGDELCSGIKSAGPVMYEISITCDTKRYNVGLGCYVGPRFGSRDVSKANRMCFHPGMHGAQFRIEGPGGMYNQNIGWRPKAWDYEKNDCAPPPKNVFTEFSLIMRPSGKHTVSLRNPEGGAPYEINWVNEDLWDHENGMSPPFGIYDGDVVSRGQVMFRDFSVTDCAGTTNAYFLGETSIRTAATMNW